MSDRIAIVSISDQLGGAEQVLFQFAEYYATHGNNNITIIIWGAKTNDFWQSISETINVVYCNKNAFTFLRAICNAAFDKVYSSHLMVNAGLGFLRTLKLLRTKKLIVRESTSVFGRYTGKKLFGYKLAYKLGYRNIDLVICQTDLMKRVLLEHCHYLSGRTQVHVIPNPFKYPGNVSQNTPIGSNEKFIVTAGRLIPEKGVDVLIHAFKDVLSFSPNLKLFILGEGEQRAFLEKLIADLSLVDQVKLLGHQNNVYPYFKNAQVCVVSSRREGFPNVLLQMMSQNNKVVSTLCAGGIQEIPGVEKCKPDDANALSNAIIKSLTDDTTTNRAMFDKELNSRGIEEFMRKIHGFLS
ncbi:glycosyltransferase [Vaginella massiliensis]|uniref:glycosyltransferase n=1 Tax=Vaginella massiliensis TaxID=1816680 RepID=UPI0037528455